MVTMFFVDKMLGGGYNIERIVEEGNYFCSENSISRLEGRTTSTNGNEINAKVGLLRIGENGTWNNPYEI